MSMIVKVKGHNMSIYDDSHTSNVNHRIGITYVDIQN